MSEYAPDPQADEADIDLVESADVVEDVEQAAAETEPVRTGVEGVDAVLRSVEELEGTPVDEHVEVFERAHETLRGALDGGA